jgi:hypothetical protein
MYAHGVAFFPRVRRGAEFYGADDFSVGNEGDKGEARGVARKRMRMKEARIEAVLAADVRGGEVVAVVRRLVGGEGVDASSLAEALFKRKWFNPFPKFKFTERPDTAAACLLEGKIVILVDNSPSAMILPTTIFDVIEEANDYYFPTLTNVYLKFARVIITIGTVFLTPLFLLFMQNMEWIPKALEFITI